MAGHSKWANIKRHKARIDAQKGKIFARISREIIVAARQGSSDPEANFQLRTAIAKAKAAGIPNDNIDRAIAKGSGQGGSGESDLIPIRYEGYGPGGIAIIIEALTDNRNRTAADLREAFSKNGGNLGETGCVSWMFEQKGVATITGTWDEEALLEIALEAGAESYDLLELEDVNQAKARGKGKTLPPTMTAEVVTAMENLEALSQTLQAQGYFLKDAEFRWIPQNTIQVSDLGQAQPLFKLMDALEDLDDVQSVTANFEVADDLMADGLA